MLAVYRTRVPSRGPGESIERSWRPRAKYSVAKGESHDALGWRHGVGLLEKYSRPSASLFSGADMGGGVPICDKTQRQASDDETTRAQQQSPQEDEERSPLSPRMKT